MTTNNHPAHGPVSLERLHQIRQYIERNNQYQNGGNRAYILADMLKVIDDAIAALCTGPVSDRDEFSLDYLQGHKDGLEWAAQLAEANHPQTGDWLYDDPIELAMAIRKGPDMPTVQDGNSPVATDGNSPVATDGNGSTVGKALTITLPDTSSKAFWSGTGKSEVFHPETYKCWAKEAIERACVISGIGVVVK